MNLSEQIKSTLKTEHHTTIEKATTEELYNAVSKAILSEIYDKWKDTQKKQLKSKQAAYLSAEFLIGRSVFNNLLNLKALKEVEEILKSAQRSASEFEEIEDSALGNGGLGRLAACFLDSAATTNKAVTGYGIKYKYGLFKQIIDIDGQKEIPDDWQKQGDPWFVKRDDLRYPITMSGKTYYAVAFDTPIIPYGNGCINTLRLFEAESEVPFDLNLWNEQEYEKALKDKIQAQAIYQVLYPNDTKEAGKKLRIMQEYFFSSAAILDMLYHFKISRTNFCDFPKMYAIQLNDTHPVLAIPILINQFVKMGISFEDAFCIAQKTFSYTNHTVMAEALEKWDCSLIKELFPEEYEIIERIQNKLKKELKSKDFFIIDGNTVHMARLAVYVCNSTNGVARLHTEILKKDVLSDWYKIYPERFKNITNGITPRRWLMLSNPELSSLITKTIGESWKQDLGRLKDLERFSQDKNFVKEFIKIKENNKAKLSLYINKKEGVKINPNSIFDIQIKRIHEYKRQLLNALGALYLYYGIKDGDIKLNTPLTILIGGKSAAGYTRAKGIIRLICEIEKLIENDKDVAPHLNLHFIENYNVSYAEKLVVAADISEQISTAGTEASGTGNMKFMLNGTVTLGTYDGANIEIVKEAGMENNYIFGGKVEDIERIKNCYNPFGIYSTNQKIKRVIDSLDNGTLSDCEIFKELKNSLLDGTSWHKADHYFVLYDFEDYINTKLRCIEDMNDREAFAKKEIMNMANAGYFSSDRAIKEYCADIWNL